MEQPGETIQDPQLKNSVILVGELKMEFPSVGQSSLVINRKQLLHSITKKADNRMCHSDYQKVMIWWWHSVVKVGRAKDYGSTVKIQALIRKWLVRFLLIERTATRDDRLEWVKWWKVHRNFPYERDPEVSERAEIKWRHPHPPLNYPLRRNKKRATTFPEQIASSPPCS